MPPFFSSEHEARPSAELFARASSPSMYPLDNGHVNVKAVGAIRDILIEAGIDHQSLFEKVEISKQSLIVNEPIPLKLLGRLTVLAADQMPCSHLGLLVGQRTTLASLGYLGMLMRHSEMVGGALHALAAHYGLLNRGAVIEMTIDGPVVLAIYSPYEPDLEGIALHCERSLAALTTVMRSLCGSDWSPDEVLLPQLQPPDPAPYTEFFRAPVRFGQEIAALAFPSRLLSHPIDGASPAVRKLAQERIQQLEAVAPPDATDEVRRRLRTTAIPRQHNKDDVARRMVIHGRTLSRRLKSEGTSFTLIVNEARFARARQLLTDTSLSLTEISGALEFSEQAAFTHAFRRWTGTTPSAWRKDHRPL